jgi:NADH-quinone oxidoreductase subunit K
MLNILIIIVFFIIFVTFLGFFFLKKNFLLMLLCLEIIFICIIIIFSILSIYLTDIIGQLYSLIILILTAIETVIGLSILVLYYRTNYNEMNIDFLNIIKKYEDKI